MSPDLLAPLGAAIVEQAATMTLAGAARTLGC
jgi:hypothetical protein